MCECIECISINLINTLLSIVIVIMNGIYVVWGLMLPHSQAKEVWKDYIERLELYVNVVSYSDAVVLPLKIVSMILVKWFCCKCEKMAKNDSDDVYDDKRISYDGKCMYKSKSNGISEFRINT